MTVFDIVDLLRAIKDRIIEPKEVHSELITSEQYEGDGVVDSDNEDIKFKSVTSDGDMEVESDGNGLILTSPDGTVEKRIYIDNDGNISTEDVS